MAIIYLLTNTINGKQYIGLTTKGLDVRWATHCDKARRGSSFHIHRAIFKYGQPAFIREVIEHTSIDEMFEREKYWIAKIQPEYNMTEGGEGAVGRAITEETRKRMSVAQSGKNNPNYGISPSKEVRDKISASLKGKVISDETRKKLSKALSGKIRYRGKNSARYGKTHSPEAKSKISKRISQYFANNKIVWVNKDGKNKRIPADQLQQFLDDEWAAGMIIVKS